MNVRIIPATEQQTEKYFGDIIIGRHYIMLAERGRQEIWRVNTYGKEYYTGSLYLFENPLHVTSFTYGALAMKVDTETKDSVYLSVTNVYCAEKKDDAYEYVVNNIISFLTNNKSHKKQYFRYDEVIRS